MMSLHIAISMLGAVVIAGTTGTTGVASGVKPADSPVINVSPITYNAGPRPNVTRDTTADERLVRDAISRLVPWLADSTAKQGTLFVVVDADSRATHAVFGSLEDFERVKAGIEDFDLMTAGMRIVELPAGSVLPRRLSVAIIEMK